MLLYSLCQVQLLQWCCSAVAAMVLQVAECVDVNDQATVNTASKLGFLNMLVKQCLVA